MRTNASTGFVVVFAGIALFPGFAAAGCQMRASLSDQMNETRYTLHPEVILKDFASGNAAMEEAVAAQIAFDGQFAAKIIAMASTATETQKEAIGRGLRRFANLCARSSPGLQRQIIAKVRQSGNRDLIDAYFQQDNTPSDPADASLALPGRAASQRPKLPPGLLLNGDLNHAMDVPPASSLPSR